MLVGFIGLADAVLLPLDCPALLAHEGQRHHLPEDFFAEAIVVDAGTDIEDVLRS